MNDISPVRRECHPACLLLPAMSEAEFKQLVEDIRNNGQRHSIITDSADIILDGRHRWRACQELSLEPRVEVFHGTEAEKIALVISANIHRRHLTDKQRAHIAADLATMGRGGDRSKPPVGGMTTAKAAELTHSPKRSVERAKKIKREDPKAHELAKTGTLKKAKATPRPKIKNRQGYIIGSNGKGGPSLLEALGRVVAFTPMDAKKYVAEHPEEASRIKDAIGPAARVIEALQEVSFDKQDAPAEDARGKEAV
jgi:ParB-like nuclease domain